MSQYKRHFSFCICGILLLLNLLFVVPLQIVRSSLLSLEAEKLVLSFLVPLVHEVGIQEDVLSVALAVQIARPSLLCCVCEEKREERREEETNKTKGKKRREKRETFFSRSLFCLISAPAFTLISLQKVARTLQHHKLLLTHITHITRSFSWSISHIHRASRGESFPF